MKRILIFTLVLFALTACTSIKIQVSPDTAATETPQAGIPNPASVHCIENGNKLEIRTAEDGSQTGICVFPDNTSCDEWAYFRGECGVVAEKETTPVPDFAATKKADDGSATDTNGLGGYMPPGSTEPFSDWWGIINSTPSGSQYDDYFERQDLGGKIYFGIDSLDPDVKAQIEALRDSGKIVHLYGTLFSNVPDYNGSQVQVERIEVK